MEEPAITTPVKWVHCDGGFVTVKCVDCGWERTFIEPEEGRAMLAEVVLHFIHGHRINLPMMTYEVR